MSDPWRTESGLCRFCHGSHSAIDPMGPYASLCVIQELRDRLTRAVAILSRHHCAEGCEIERFLEDK